MKKMTKIPLILLALVCSVAAFAGADTLTACGVPQIFANIFGSDGGALAAGLLLPIGVQQTDLVAAYKNGKMIADQVMPVKVLDGPELAFKYYERTKGDSFAAPDTHVGRTSEPNIIHLSGEEKASVAEAHGLQTIVPKEDIDQIKNKERFVNTNLEYLMNQVFLGREMRVAGIVQNTSNYGTGLSHTYEDSQGIGADGFNIVEVILDYLEKPLARPNILGMNAVVWAKLRTDANVLRAIYPNSNGAGVATREQIKALFEVDDILIGEARVNTTKNAKNPTLERCWGNNIWAHYTEPLSTLKEGIAWGMTAQVGDRYATIIEDEKIGLKGAEIIKAGFYQKEVVVAKDAGFLLKNVIKAAG